MVIKLKLCFRSSNIPCVLIFRAYLMLCSSNEIIYLADFLFLIKKINSHFYQFSTMHGESMHQWARAGPHGTCTARTFGSKSGP